MTQRNSAVEDEVRRRLQDRLAAAGVDERRVALEVMYWMPARFMAAYQVMFLKALKLGDEGQGVNVGSLGGGKRYRGSWVVKDELFLEVKKRVDRQLEKLVQRTVDKVRAEAQGEETNSWRNPRGESQGSIPGRIVRTPDKRQRICEDCGKLMAKGWLRCPFH